ncbi:E3 ubiquitin ligase TRAF3IP2-like isoform X1 [Anguilla rostrata]|uniref:E3 ubiquitin ligase TRAF3IP2-like isoform X1 n=1 Tax=Anguilla rostrata TaxID=7938 RepID=UPI0030D1C962
MRHNDFPSLSCSTMTQRLGLHLDSLEPESSNCPEENDETVSEDSVPSMLPSEPHSASSLDPHTPAGSLSGMTTGFSHAGELGQSLPSSSIYRPPHAPPVSYEPATPYPSWGGCPSTLDPHKGAWLHPSLASSFSGYPSSLPAGLPSEGYPSFPVAGPYPLRGSHSLPGRCSPSLEQPGSLHSVLSNTALPHGYYLAPFPCQPPGPTCCSRCPAEGFSLGAPPHHSPWLGYHQPHQPSGPYHCGWPGAGSSQSGYAHPHLNKKTPTCSVPLSLEHRKVFVTYEADSDGHVNEIIKFVALLRHNGFDTRIDVFEQQFRSISKIDFMEKFISEKDYLIIIVISPKYYETVTGAHMSMENDERTLNTVYIHKQLQNEFIQNGSRNFRFIPILFPGARKCHVPTWLQNTHVYSWPRDRDDVLRRLMRVEKYNPPPIGELPTIVSIPL